MEMKSDIIRDGIDEQPEETEIYQIGIEELDIENIKYMSFNNMIENENRVNDDILHDIENGIIPHPNDCEDKFGEFVDPTLNNYIHCDNPKCKWHQYIPEPLYTTVQKIYEYTIIDANSEEFRYTLCDECYVTKCCKLCLTCFKLHDVQYIYSDEERDICLECKNIRDNKDEKDKIDDEPTSYKIDMVCTDLNELIAVNQMNRSLFYMPTEDDDLRLEER